MRTWPEPLEPEAFHGLAGDFVQTVEPHTESDPAALLSQFLVAFGSVIGRGAHFVVENDIHHLKINAVLVGETAKGRKGTSIGHVRTPYAEVDEVWAKERIMSGLSSGEGLIWQVRDPIHKTESIKKGGAITGYQDVMVDKGVTDKRLLALEPEFASVLRVLERDGNTLSAIIRQAWDGGDIRTLTKNNPATATDCHISTIGHVTMEELKRYLSRTEMGNGFANRFLWFCVRRSRCLPEGGNLDPAEMVPLILELQEAVEFGKKAGELTRDEGFREIWRNVYPELSEGKPGLVGAIISRAEAQVMRIASLYALLDQTTVLCKEHLLAALAVCEYAEASVRYIFGDATGDPVADEIFAAISRSPEGMSRTEIRDLFKRHGKKEEIKRALSLLEKKGKAHPVHEETGGRPTERWVLGCDKSDKSDERGARMGYLNKAKSIAESLCDRSSRSRGRPVSLLPDNWIQDRGVARRVSE